MGLDHRVQGSSRSETRGLVAAIINSFNETGNPPVARVQRAMPAPLPPWRNLHIRWKDDGSCVPAASPTAPTPTPENAPGAIDQAHPPRPASPTPRDQRKRPREDVPALGDLPSGPATRKTNGQPSDDEEDEADVSRPPVGPRRGPSFSEALWDPDLDRRLGRIFRLRVDRDGNPRGDAGFADDKYPLRWVRLVTIEHQLASGNRPTGEYAACATEENTWEAANRAFSRRESREKKKRGFRKRPVVFYESLDLESLESKHDVEYLDLHRYPHPGEPRVAAADPEADEKYGGDGERNENRSSRRDERPLMWSAVAGLASLAAVAPADTTADARLTGATAGEKAPPEAPGSPERVARRAPRSVPPPPRRQKRNGRTNEPRGETNGNLRSLCFKRSLADRIAPDVVHADDDGVYVPHSPASNARAVGYVGFSKPAFAFGEEDEDRTIPPQAEAAGAAGALARALRDAGTSRSPPSLVPAGKRKSKRGSSRASSLFATKQPPARATGSAPVCEDPLREEVRRLRLRIELVDCRLRIEREERRLNETRLMAALREARRATARARADVERIAARR